MLFLHAAGKCIWRVLSEYSGAFGALFSISGSVAELLGQKAVMPNWGWIAFGALLLFFTACKIEMELMQEKEKNRKPRPSMSLLEVIRRIRGKEHVFGDRETIETVRAFTRIKELALNGEIVVFGSPGIQYLPEGGDVDAVLPRVPIPAKDWEECSLSYLDFVKQPTCGRVESDDSSNRPFGSGYGYIWFDRKQIDSIWPAHRHGPIWRRLLPGAVV